MRTFSLLTAAAVLFAGLAVSSPSLAQGKQPLINTRGACLKVKDFKALIDHESKKLQPGQTLTLMADIPNEKEVREAVQASGHTIVEETRDKDKDLLTLLLRVNK